MFEERKEHNPRTHTFEPHSFFLQQLKCLIFFSPQGQVHLLEQVLQDSLPDPSPPSLYYLSSHVLICSDSLRMVIHALYLQLLSNVKWEDHFTPFVPWIAFCHFVCECLRLKAPSGWDLMCLGSVFPATAPGENVLSTWWLEVWWPEREECGVGGSCEMRVIPDVCWALTVRQALGSSLTAFSQSSAKLSDV